ncbi:hypothetical protein HDU67_001374 [Dinochytrium kinnereticum]|nr:hypothetical protein HDU67_001374 [Dinochytrium kinnereticum]
MTGSKDAMSKGDGLVMPPPPPMLRTIIQLDLDYFYAQAEEVLDPSLKDHPVGIQQKQIIVTCNYKARGMGVKKLQLLSSALEACPTLRVLNGEDISKYRRFSRTIGELIRGLLNGPLAAIEDPNVGISSGSKSKWPVAVERMGLDEVFLDVTNIIEEHLNRLEGLASGDDLFEHGVVWPDGEVVFRFPGADAGRATPGTTQGRGSAKKATGVHPFSKKMKAISDQLGAWGSGFSYKSDMFQEETLVIGGDEDYEDTNIDTVNPYNPVMDDLGFNGHGESSHFPCETPTERSRWASNPQLRNRQLTHLRIASFLAKHIRSTLRACTGFTTSAGIASSKLHAKLAAGMKKPDGQTLIVPFSRAAEEIVDRLDVRRVQGVGYRGYTMIRDFVRNGAPSVEDFGTWRAAMGGNSVVAEPDIEPEDNDADAVMYEPTTMKGAPLSTTIGGQQQPEAHCQGWGDEDELLTVKRVRDSISLEGWVSLFGKNGARLHQLVHGIDDSPVATTGWPTQISVEDSFTRCVTLQDARARLIDLTHALINRFHEEESVDSDSQTRRIASQFRLTIRRRNSSSNRESQSCTMPAEFHDTRRPAMNRAVEMVDRTLMPVFGRLVGRAGQVDITLINVAAVKLRVRGGERSITEFWGGRNVKGGDWDEEVLERLGIDKEVFEELPVDVRNEVLRGRVRQEVGGGVTSPFLRVALEDAVQPCSPLRSVDVQDPIAMSPPHDSSSTISTPTLSTIIASPNQRHPPILDPHVFDPIAPESPPHVKSQETSPSKRHAVPAPRHQHHQALNSQTRSFPSLMEARPIDALDPISAARPIDALDPISASPSSARQSSSSMDFVDPITECSQPSESLGFGVERVVREDGNPLSRVQSFSMGCGRSGDGLDPIAQSGQPSRSLGSWRSSSCDVGGPSRLSSVSINGGVGQDSSHSLLREHKRMHSDGSSSPSNKRLRSFTVPSSSSSSSSDLNEDIIDDEDPTFFSSIPNKDVRDAHHPPPLQDDVEDVGHLEDVDPEVFHELPEFIRREVLASRRRHGKPSTPFTPSRRGGKKGSRGAGRTGKAGNKKPTGKQGTLTGLWGVK